MHTTRRRMELDGKKPRVRQDLVRGGAASWLMEPQADLTVANGVAVPSRPDFLLRPMRGDARRWPCSWMASSTTKAPPAVEEKRWRKACGRFEMVGRSRSCSPSQGVGGKDVQLTAVIEREGEGYVALCPQLDIASQGETVALARENLKEALELFFETASSEEVSRRLHGEVYVTQVEVSAAG